MLIVYVCVYNEVIWEKHASQTILLLWKVCFPSSFIFGINSKYYLRDMIFFLISFYYKFKVFLISFRFAHQEIQTCALWLFAILTNNQLVFWEIFFCPNIRYQYILYPKFIIFPIFTSSAFAYIKLDFHWCGDD